MAARFKGNPSCDTCSGSGVLNNDAVDDCWCIDSKKKKVKLEKKLANIELLEEFKENLILIKNPDNRGTFYLANLDQKNKGIYKKLTKSFKKQADEFVKFIENTDFIKEQIINLLNKLENAACDCEVMLGYNCENHKYSHRIKDLLKLF